MLLAIRGEGQVATFARRGGFVNHVCWTVVGPWLEQEIICLDDMPPDDATAVAKCVLVPVDSEKRVATEQAPRRWPDPNLSFSPKLERAGRLSEVGLARCRTLIIAARAPACVENDDTINRRMALIDALPRMIEGQFGWPLF